MIKNLRVLIAEDVVDSRDILIENLNEYAESINNEISFSITEAEHFQKAMQILSENENNPFHILFVDIDFTEDNKGGSRNSGFEIIKKAFQICPISKICTYSGQFHAKDLWQEYETLKNQGLILESFDKSHTDGGDVEYFNKQINDLLNDFTQSYYLWDIWQNHNEMVKSIKSSKLALDFQQNLLKQDEIISNLETILKLLQKLNLIGADLIVYRLILQLYQRNLEIFCSGDKSEEDIYKISEINKAKLASILNKDDDWELGKDVSALRRILSFEIDEVAKYGWRLNDYRNKSVHPIQKRKDGKEYKFVPELSNVIFANLVLSLYVVGNKRKISVEKFLELISDKKLLENNKFGLNSLNELIDYIK